MLLDVLMPELDGFEVCRRMKANPKMAEIPVLFVTVLNQDETRVEGLELGPKILLAGRSTVPNLLRALKPECVPRGR